MNTNQFTLSDATKQSVLNQAEITTKLNVVSSRAETLSIVVNIINSILSVKQNSDNPVSDDIIAAIQNAINTENTITHQLFSEVEAIMNHSVNEATEAEKVDEATDSEIVEEDITETTEEN